jgi:hypothetical protein
MSNDATTPILSALEIAAFERRPDGSFASLGPVPEWFSVLGRDKTFPFLGTFLEDARIHWASSPSGRLRSGLCNETDEHGREYHFEVSAIVLGGRNLLVFELAPALEGMRLALQKARQQALNDEARGKNQGELFAAVTTLSVNAQDARRAARAVGGFARELAAAAPAEPAAQRLATELDTTSTRLQSIIDSMAETIRIVARKAPQS